MVGYSTPNKDVGYVASGWGRRTAPSRASPRCWGGHGVLDAGGFFHGRGGAVGRGGGPSQHRHPGAARRHGGRAAEGHRAGRGGLAAKYAVDEIARRELELTTSAVL